MSNCECMPEAFITEVEALAPFMDYSKGTEKKLIEMGVINENSELNQGAITALATVFASNFNNCCNDFYIDDFEMIDIAFDAFKSLFYEDELSGAYVYLLLCCGMTDCRIPYELTWIARREDALLSYLEKFIDAMKQNEATFEEKSEN